MNNRLRRTTTIVAGLLTALILGGWNAPGHRIITRSAISTLPNSIPSWVRDSAGVELTAFQANEPDRWRGTRLEALSHENNGDHYIDIEELDNFGLSLQTLPPLRYHFIEALVKAHSQPSGGLDRGNDRFDPARVGMVPYAIMEHYTKLVASYNTARIIEQIGGPNRGYQLRAARANAIYHMGQLSHFVGDSAQPLHTTIHHHGWVGDNPNGYTTDRSFHSYIDGGVIQLHGLNTAALTEQPLDAADIPADSVWDAVIGLLKRSHAAVEPLYQLQASGDLQRQPGRVFIATRLRDAASVLAGMYRRAWIESEPTPKQVADFIRYNDFAAETRWNAPPAPSSSPN